MIDWAAIFSGAAVVGIAGVGKLVLSLHAKVNEMNGDFKGLKEWKFAHEKQDDTFHGEMKLEVGRVWTEINKLRDK